MATLGQLRKKAKELGFSASDIRSATSADELQGMILEHVLNGSTTKTARKPAARKATATRTATKPVRGRPKATTTAVKSKPAAKSTVGKAKRSTADTNGNSGRNMLEDVDYNMTEGWGAREGSPPDLIVKSLRKYRGDREKVFQALLPKIGTFVGAKMQDGTKRTKASAETMLRYRISRTAWDFAMKTGQHEKSSNRAEYGTQGTYKKPGATGAARKPQKAQKATTTRKATTTTRKPQRAAQKPAAGQKRRGRPPGSKNKPKVATTTARKPVAKKKSASR